MRPVCSRPSTPADFCVGHLEDGLHAAFASTVRGVHVRSRSLERTLEDYYHRGEDGGNGNGAAGGQLPLVVAGPAGSGKSSSLADWTARRREDAEDSVASSSFRGAGGGIGGGGDFVFYHAAGCSRNSVSVGHFLRRLMTALKRHFDLPAAVDEDDARLPWTFPRVLQQASRKGRVLVVLDGLHHMRPLRAGKDDDSGFNLKWLPRTFPSNARVVLSMSTCEEDEAEGVEDPEDCVAAADLNDHAKHRRSKIQHVMQEARRREWPVVFVGPLNDERVEDIIDGIRRIPLEDLPGETFSQSRPRDPICFSEPMLGATGSPGLDILPGIENVVASHPLAKHPQFLVTLLRVLAYSARQGFDLWTCLDRWGDVGGAEELLFMALDDFEAGHRRTKAGSERAAARLSASAGCGSDESQGYRSDFNENSDGSDGYSESSAETCQHANVEPKGDVNKTESAPVYLRGGCDVDGLGPLLGYALALLFVSRHGLHERELWALLERVRKNEKWLEETLGTILPIELKIFRSLAVNKKRLIDVFRSFDTDGSGTLSHEEIYRGMEQLDVGVNHSDVTDLIKVVDTNQDGELDYREMLDHFEHHSKRYMHGKRRESLVAGGLVGSTKGAARRTVRLTGLKVGTLDSRHREALLSSLISLGITYVRAERVVILPLESTALRDVVWTRYIGSSKKGEDRWHSVLIDFFSRQEPNLRRCEELPWHLRKCSRYLALKQTLVDLRTFDIMYNNGMSFRVEIFEYLRLLTDGGTKSNALPESQDSSIEKDPTVKKTSSRVSTPPFDIVDEYNHAVELWYHGTRPSAVRLAAMVIMIGRFMKWFSERMSAFSKPPPFMRSPLDFDKLQSIGLDKAFISKSVPHIDAENEGERPVTRGNVQHFSQEETIRNQCTPYAPYYMYFFDRWIWLQFPWMALKNASLHCENVSRDRKVVDLSANDQVTHEDIASATQGNSRETSFMDTSPSKSKNRQFWDIKKEDPYEQKANAPNTSATRDTAMARSECSKKSASMRKVEKIQSMASKGVKESCSKKGTAAIPFAYSSNRTKTHGSRFPSAKNMHHDAVRHEEENLDAIARKATMRFGGQSHPRDFGDVIDIRREDEACANASRGLSHTSAHSTFVLTQNELEIGGEMQNVANLRDLFDKLKLESKSKEERLRDLEISVAERDLGDRQVHEKVVAGEEILNMLQERLDRLNGLVQDASSLREFFRQITLALDATNPDKHKKSLRSLEQHIALSRQQKEDLLKTKQDIHTEIEGINLREKSRWRDMRRSSDEKRGKIQYNLKHLRKHSRIPLLEADEKHRPTMRSPLLATKKSFSSRESKLIALDAIGRRKSKASHNDLEKALSEADAEDLDGHYVDDAHPMEVITNITGSFDPGEISRKLVQSDKREVELQSQQSEQEETIARLKQKLINIHEESKDCRLTEEDCCREDTSADMRLIGENVRNAEIACVHHAKKTEKVLALTNKVSSGISHLLEMVHVIAQKQLKSSHKSANDADLLKLRAIKEHLCLLLKSNIERYNDNIETGEALSPDGTNHDAKAAHNEAKVWWGELGDAKEVSDDEMSVNLGSPSEIRVLNRNQVDISFEKQMNKAMAEKDRETELEEKALAGFDVQKENGGCLAASPWSYLFYFVLLRSVFIASFLRPFVKRTYLHICQ